jgi:hypothetical protein
LTESPVCPNCHGPVSLHIGTVYQAVTAIVSVFQYMNQIFVISRLKKDLTVVLFQLFIDEVAKSDDFIGEDA